MKLLYIIDNAIGVILSLPTPMGHKREVIYVGNCRFRFVN